MRTLKLPETSPDVRALYCQHYKAMVEFCRDLVGSEAEDVAQEVYSRIVRDPGVMSGFENARAWLLRVAYRSALDVLRRSGRMHCLTEPGDPRVETTITPLQQLVRSEELRELQRAIDRLPLPLRAAMHLKYYSNLANPEIASVLGISTNHVAVHLVRAKQILRAQFKEPDHE